MDAAWKAVAVAVPLAALTAWLTARATVPSGGSDAAPRDGAAPAARVERHEQAAAARDDRELVRRIEALEARLGGDAPAATAPPAPTTTAPAADDKARQEVVVGLTTEPASSDHRAAVKRLAEHLVKSAGPPVVEKEFVWVAQMLDREARRERVTPDEAEDLAPVLFALPSGHAARPTLAKAVALGWGRDARLAGFLPRFAANTEPSVHQAMLAALDDEHPSPAFSEYVTRIVREERDSTVLATALGLDRIEAAATSAVAPALMQAIETRVLDGSLDAKMRARAALALGVAGIKAPDVGAAALRRVADREADAKLAERERQAATTLADGTATLKSIERLFE